MATTATSRLPQAGGDSARPVSNSSASQAVTASRSFWPATPAGQDLFAVQAGVPLTDALDQLAILLNAAQAAANYAAMPDPDATDLAEMAWIPAHLLTMANALRRAIHNGYLESLRGQGEGAA